MSDAAPITFEEVETALSSLRLGVSASDLHGSLTGYLCGGGKTDTAHWLDALELDSDELTKTAAQQKLLARLYEECLEWLNDPELPFEPLLPSQDVALDARSAALVDWCRGFLGGIGLAGVGKSTALSAEAKEILNDFATIAATQFENANAEEDENALVEVIEFLRVGVMLLHSELNHVAISPARAGETLH